MANSIVVKTSAVCCSTSCSLPPSVSSSSSLYSVPNALTSHILSLRGKLRIGQASVQGRRRVVPGPAVQAVGRSTDPSGDASHSGEDCVRNLLDTASGGTQEKQVEEGIVLSPSRTPLQVLSKAVAMGLVMRAAAGTGWTTGSGLEGPSGSMERDSNSEEESQQPLFFSKSPRRKMRVAFTCNVCGVRTTRAINPHAYTDGTVFVQCKGCEVFHKLVDNLNLFHELKGRIYEGYDTPGFAHHQSQDIFGLDEFPYF